MNTLFYIGTILVFYCLLMGGIFIVSRPEQNSTRLFILPLSGFILWLSAYLLPLLAPVLPIEKSFLSAYTSEIYGWNAIGALILAVGLILFAGEHPIRYFSFHQKKRIALSGLGIVLLFGFLIFRTNIIFQERLLDLQLDIGQGYGLFTSVLTVLYAIVFVILGLSLKTNLASHHKNTVLFLFTVIFTGFSTPYISTHILPLFTGVLEFTWWGLTGPSVGGIIFIYALCTQNIFNFKIVGADMLLLAMSLVLMSLTLSSNSAIVFGFNFLTLIIFGILAFFLIHELLLEKHRQHKISEANQTLAETVNAKEHFLRLTSHQLRTPLSNIEGYLNILLKSPTEEYGYPAEVRTYLEKAHINYQRLNSIVDDISITNKISTNHWSVHTDPHVNIPQIINEIVDYNHYLAQTYNVSITKNFSSVISEPEGNKTLLFVALDNLLRNSIMYGSTSVEIRVKPKEHSLYIKIIDDEIGITEEEMNAVYRQFQRADRAEREHPDGSGIGVYIAKAIIEKHEGSLDIYSNGAGKGTVVTIILPLAPSQKYISQ